LGSVAGGAGGGGVGAEVRLGEGDGDRGVGWEVEFWVAFAPVSGFLLVKVRQDRDGGRST